MATITGNPTPGVLPVSEVSATLDESDPSASTMTARVETAGVTSSKPQMAGSLPDPERFDSVTHPETSFASSVVRREAETMLEVDGTLIIKDLPLDVSFPMTIARSFGDLLVICP